MRKSGKPMKVKISTFILITLFLVSCNPELNTEKSKEIIPAEIGAVPLRVADSCNPIRKYFSNPSNRPAGTNGIGNYGVHIASNFYIDPSYHFKVIPAEYITEDGGKTNGLKTNVYNSSGKLLCSLNGGPMLRSPEVVPSQGLYVPMKMSFDLVTKNFFTQTALKPGPHIPVVLLGELGTVASEGIGPIFGNVSTFPTNGRCTPPSSGRMGNYSAIESFRNNQVCVFGNETSSFTTYSDQTYHIEASAMTIINNGAIKNQIDYTVTSASGEIIAQSSLLDDPLTTELRGGWLIFNVIGGVAPFSYDIWINNLKIDYTPGPVPSAYAAVATNNSTYRVLDVCLHDNYKFKLRNFDPALNPKLCITTVEAADACLKHPEIFKTLDEGNNIKVGLDFENPGFAEARKKTISPAMAPFRMVIFAKDDLRSTPYYVGAVRFRACSDILKLNIGKQTNDSLNGDPCPNTYQGYSMIPNSYRAASDGNIVSCKPNFNENVPVYSGFFPLLSEPPQR